MVVFKAFNLVHVSTTKQLAIYLIKTLPGDVIWRHVVAIMHAFYIITVKSALHAQSL